MELLQREPAVLERLVEDLLVMADPVAQALDCPETSVGLALVTGGNACCRAGVQRVS
jgi:hypothetical protein